MAVTGKALYGTDEGAWMQIEFTENVVPPDYLRMSVDGKPRLLLFVTRLIFGHPETNREHPAVQAWMKHRQEEYLRRTQNDSHPRS